MIIICAIGDIITLVGDKFNKLY